MGLWIRSFHSGEVLAFGFEPPLRIRTDTTEGLKPQGSTHFVCRIEFIIPKSLVLKVMCSPGKFDDRS